MRYPSKQKWLREIPIFFNKEDLQGLGSIKMVFSNNTLPFALLGFLFGIIFVSDGWLSYQGPDQSFSKSPKVRGLLYILGGGVISLIGELTQEANVEKASAISVYTLFVTLSIILGLVVLVLYSALVSFKRLREVSREESLIETAIEVLPFIAVAIQEGNKKFIEELEQELIPQNIQQRNDIIEFTARAYNNLCEYQFNNLKECHNFEEFVEEYLEEFIQIFLDNSLVNYRACLYFLDKEQDKLLFFTGYTTLTTPFSKEDLPNKNSLAGYAIRNPFVAHFYSTFQTSSSLPFVHRSNHKKYKTVAICAVKHPTLDHSSFPNMALCVDCIHGKHKAFGDLSYISKIIVLLSIVFANALTLMDINDKAIKQYIVSRR
ncbi:MAG: hypothetical protein F6K41_19450 [Symploca sp. SIO3E6]|nr:hypothetical protein [Caldora sp. SIO3E6]